MRIVDRYVNSCKIRQKPLHRIRVGSYPVYYRPQRSWAKVILSQACVCPQGGGVSASVHAGIYPRTRQTPREQAPPPGPGRPTLEQAPPGSRHPPPRADHPPLPQTRRTPPPREADFSIRSTSGRYASYWNASLCCD